MKTIVLELGLKRNCTGIPCYDDFAETQFVQEQCSTERKYSFAIVCIVADSTTKSYVQHILEYVFWIYAHSSWTKRPSLASFFK